MTEVKFRLKALLVLGFLLVSRLLAMVLMSLNDSTEARYGEIARIMLETGDWRTPMQSAGVPFWAKPPLSTWLSALSMGCFGVNAFAVRFPSLLLSIGILWLIWDLARKRHDAQLAWITVLVLAGSLFFYLDAGTVMTDPALIFCTTLGFVSFWHAVVEQNKTWGYFFFVSLGLGLLAKGPIALVLMGMPIFFWVLRHKQRWIALWKHLPWIKGTGLMLLIAVPWYVLAELKTPGFLNYFIIGEHIRRFLEPGWGGDKYGFAHVAPLGMIWVYAFLGIFPWSIMGIAWLIRNPKGLKGLTPHKDGWMSYLMLWTLMPLLFFTLSSNIIYTYAFPSLPPFALLFAECAARVGLSEKEKSRFIVFAALSGIIFLCVTALFVLKPEWVEKSQRRVITAFHHECQNPHASLLYWAPKTDFSAQFYSGGHAMATLSPSDLSRFLLSPEPHYLVVNSKNQALPPEVFTHATAITTVAVLKNRMILFRVD